MNDQRRRNLCYSSSHRFSVDRCNASRSLVFFEYLIQCVEKDVRVLRLEDERRTHAHRVISASGRIDTCQSNRKDMSIKQEQMSIKQDTCMSIKEEHMSIKQDTCQSNRKKIRQSNSTHVNQTGHVHRKEHISIKQEHCLSNSNTCQSNRTHANQPGTLSISIKQDTCQSNSNMCQSNRTHVNQPGTRVNQTGHMSIKQKHVSIKQEHMSIKQVHLSIKQE